MKTEQQKALYDKYPIIFQDVGKSPMTTGMHWGIQTGDGWYKLIDQLCDRIQNHKTESPVIATQVKEKFGTLRFYYYGGDNYIDELVTFAGYESERTCEICSEPGTMRNDGWMKVRCDSCMEKEND